MKTLFLTLAAAAAFAVGCTPAPAAAPAPEFAIDPPAAMARAFAATGVAGTFVLYDPQRGRWHFHDEARARRGALPASTFKVPHAMIALETGALPDEHEVFRWDGVPRRVAPWNQDQDLRSAMRNSTVWVFQEIARRIGPERMTAHLERIGYGNREIGGGLEWFWLTGGLRVSPVEQVEFLTRFARGDLPFSERTLAIVRDAIEMDRGDGWVLRAKTGWTDHPTPDLGWYVGWLERGDEVYVFAMNMDIVQNADAAHRAAITRRVLGELGLM